MKCEVCNKKATGHIKVDVDISGIGYCKEHEKEVSSGFFILVTLGLPQYERYIKSLKTKLCQKKKTK